MNTTSYQKLRNMLGRTTPAGLFRNVLVAAILAASVYAYAHMAPAYDDSCFWEPEQEELMSVRHRASRSVPLFFAPSDVLGKFVFYSH